MTSAGLGIVLVTGDYETAHAAFLMAAGAASLNRAVILFATGRGVLALCRDWTLLAGADRDALLQARGVAGLADLRAACLELGVPMLACPSGLQGANIALGALLAGVAGEGISSFLERTARAQLLSF